MIATLLPQLNDRIREAESDQLSGAQKDAESKRFQELIDGLKDRVEALKGKPDEQARTDYLKNVEETFAKFKSAQPKKATHEEDESKSEERKQEKDSKESESKTQTSSQPDEVRAAVANMKKDEKKK